MGSGAFPPQELSELDGDLLWRWDMDCDGIKYPSEQETSQRTLEFNQSRKWGRLGPVLVVCFSQSLRIWSSSQNEQHPHHQLCFLQWEEVPCVVAPWRSVPDHHFKAWGGIGRNTFQRQISHLRFQKSWKERINREGARECFTLSLWPHRYARGGGWMLKSTRFFPSFFPCCSNLMLHIAGG